MIKDRSFRWHWSPKLTVMNIPHPITPPLPIEEGDTCLICEDEIKKEDVFHICKQCMDEEMVRLKELGL